MSIFEGYEEHKDAADLLNNMCSKGSEPDYATVWEACDSADWMLEFAERCGVPRQTLVGCAAEIVGAIEYLLTDRRSIDALRVCERYGRGETTDKELRKAYTAAAAAATFRFDVSSVATRAVASAAMVEVSDAAAAAAAYAAYAAAHTNGSDIVRKWIKFEDLELSE